MARSLAYLGQEFTPNSGFLHGSAHGCGHRVGEVLFDPPHHHAKVLAFNLNANTLGTEFFVEGRGDLLGHPFLDLETLGKHVDQAGNLGEADDLFIRDIRNVAATKEGQNVVFAEAEKLDVANEDHVLVLDVKKRLIDQFVDIHLVARGQSFHALQVALRGLEESLTFGVFAASVQQTFDILAEGLIGEFSLGQGQPFCSRALEVL